jgi:hypothetical protein
MVYHVVYSVFILDIFSKLKKMFYVFLKIFSIAIIFCSKFSFISMKVWFCSKNFLVIIICQLCTSDTHVSVLSPKF